MADRQQTLFVRLNGRLAQFKSSPTRDYWEHQWSRLTREEVAYALRRSRSMAGHAAFLRRHLRPGSAVLEAGCGTGIWVRRLRENGYRAIGLDFAHDSLRRSKRVAPELPFVTGDLRELPFPAESLDAHLSFGVIEHYADGPGALLEEACRVLRRGGTLLASVPQVNAARRRIAGCSPNEAERLGYRFHQYYFERRELNDLVSNFGFDPIDDSHCYSTLHGLRERSRLLCALERHIPPLQRVGIALDYIPLLASRFGHMRFIVARKR